MSMTNYQRIEYALAFDDVPGEIHPLGNRSPRQVARQLEGLRGNVTGSVSVVARGSIQITGEWKPVEVDPMTLQPIEPTWEELGLKVVEDKPEPPDAHAHDPLVPELAIPTVPVQEAGTKKVRSAPRSQEL